MKGKEEITLEVLLTSEYLNRREVISRVQIQFYND